MKKTFSIFFALILVSGVVLANNEMPASVSGLAVVKKGSTLRVFYKGSSLSDVKVNIYNSKNEIIFTEIIRHTDGFIRPYNFSDLPEGDYKVAITDKTGRREETVNYREDEVKKIIKVLPVAGENNKYLLSVASKSNDVIYVKIYDAFNRVLFEQSEKLNGDFAQIYNLQALKNKHALEVSDNKGVISTYGF